MKYTPLVEAAPDMLAALKALDAWWLVDFPGGPEGDRRYKGGVGILSDDTVAIWQTVQTAIAKAEGIQL